jgi:hypothetical protein
MVVLPIQVVVRPTAVLSIVIKKERIKIGFEEIAQNSLKICLMYNLNPQSK